MKNKVISKLFGKELISVMKDLVEKFKSLDYSVDLIVKDLNDINESVRVGLYLIALENNYDVVASRINKANKILNDKRKDKFLKAYKEGNVDKFLASLGKGDKLSLLDDLGLNVDIKDRGNLTKEEKEYFKLISNSIMEEQSEDKRDGIDQFIKYKKEAN